jgi:hypothetical protein
MDNWDILERKHQYEAVRCNDIQVTKCALTAERTKSCQRVVSNVQAREGAINAREHAGHEFRQPVEGQAAGGGGSGIG